MFMKDLKKKNHHCLYLQRAWDKYGEENFDFIIYKRFETEEESIALEQYIIDNYKKYLYNVSNYAKGGGDLISNNPNKEMIISKRTKTQLKNMSKMTKEERAEKYGLKGSLNGLYGKSRTPEFKKKLSEIKKGQIPYNKNKKLEEIVGEERALIIKEEMSKKAKERKGSLNPFYGKKHSNKTKQKIRESRLGNLPTNSRKVEIDE